MTARAQRARELATELRRFLAAALRNAERVSAAGAVASRRSTHETHLLALDVVLLELVERYGWEGPAGHLQTMLGRLRAAGAAAAPADDDPRQVRLFGAAPPAPSSARSSRTPAAKGPELARARSPRGET